MNLDRYLARIGYGGPRTPSPQALRQLHRAHLFSIPFENLSIGWGEPIELNDVAHYWKLVECRRGGFCYEQNSLFAWALRALGYEVTLLAAQVFSAESGGHYGLPMSHLLLRVDVEGPMLVDVGFGDHFLNPIVMRLGAIHQESIYRGFRLTEDEGLFTLEMREGEGPFVPRYRFALTARQIDEFADMCNYHQHSPESPFTQGRIVTQARPDGRISLSDHHLIETRSDYTKLTQEVDNEAAFNALLLEHFDIVAPQIGSTPAWA